MLLYPADGLALHQVSLLDLLRLLRQRRRTDPIAAQFVAEQQRMAAAAVMQVVFSLRSSERLVATAPCTLGLSTREGHLYITPRSLAYSTLLGADAKVRAHSHMIRPSTRVEM